MGNTTLAILAILGTAMSAWGAEENPYWPWGPLTKQDALPHLTLTSVKWKEIEKVKQDTSVFKRTGMASDGKTELELTRNEEGFFARVLVEGKEQMAPKLCTTFFPFFENMHYCGYLNDDGQIDFMLSFYCGGNGLNANYNDNVFILSTREGYQATRIGSFGGRPEQSFVRVGGKPHYIMESFGGKGECLDGKPHNFWIYNLLEIKGDSLYLANQNHANFPRTIWYTFKPNSKETDMLSMAQKNDLLIQSVKNLQLIGNRVPPCPSAVKND